MILVDWQIREAVESQEIGIRGFSEECVEPASYDLRVGEEGCTSSSGGTVQVGEEGELRIAPGEFALVLSHEYLKLPSNFLGRFGLRSTHARRGLLAATGPQVDPGFEGKLAIGLVNFSPETIMLAYLEKFCSLELHRLNSRARHAYDGPYQKQEHLTERIVSQLPQEAMPLARMFFTQLAAYLPGLQQAVAARRRPVVPSPSLADRRHVKFRREKRAFEELKPELLKTHRGKYVVIHEGQVALTGDDEVELARQAYEQFGYVELYIGLVAEEAPAVHIPSPRIRGEEL
jgi:dCTP deaminase